MKKPVVVVGSIILCLIIVCVAFIGLVVLSDSNPSAFDKTFPE